MNFLLIEDEPNLAHLIRQGLEDFDHTVQWESTGESGIKAIESKPFDALILDINLPGISGWEVSEIIRSKAGLNLPVLMLTALDDTDSVVRGLSQGADDYLAKPFKFRELEARLKNIVRRNQAEDAPLPGKIEANGLLIDPGQRIVSTDGTEVQLTAREFDLLYFLAKNAHRVIPRKEILEKVWDIHFDLGTNVIDVYISYLRNKVEKPSGKKFIHTVVGVGYQFRIPKE